MAKPSEILSTRERVMTALDIIKHEVKWIENQLAALPFYSDYVDKLSSINEMEKDIKWLDAQLFSKMKEWDLKTLKGKNLMAKIVKSTKSSIVVTDPSLLPEDAFEKSIKWKKDLWKLIDEYNQEGKPIHWVELVYVEKLEIF